MAFSEARPPGRPRARPGQAFAVLLLAVLVVLVGTVASPSFADIPEDGVDGSHPAELQHAPEDGQEQFGEASDERTEELVRWLRTGLGVAVGIVMLLLVVVVPLRLRRREPGEGPPADPGRTNGASPDKGPAPGAQRTEPPGTNAPGERPSDPSE